MGASHALVGLLGREGGFVRGWRWGQASGSPPGLPLLLGQPTPAVSAAAALHSGPPPPPTLLHSGSRAGGFTQQTGSLGKGLITEGATAGNNGTEHIASLSPLSLCQTNHILP